MASLFVTDYTVWGYWTTSSNTTTVTDSTWNVWCAPMYSTGAYSTGATTMDVWAGWVDQTCSSSPMIVNDGQWRQPTPAEIEARAEQQRLQAERARVEAEKRTAARVKAKALLVEMLNQRQRREFEKDGEFTVITKNGLRHYKLKPGAQPLRVKGEDGAMYRYCIHPSGQWPAEDTALTLKLLLEADEAEFLRIANATRVAA